MFCHTASCFWPYRVVEAAKFDFGLYPNLYPNPPQHHPTQTDTSRGGLSGNPAPLGHPPTSSDTRRPISLIRAENPAYGPTLRFSVIGFLEKSSLPAEIRFDDLRQGMPLHAVSKMLGHSDPAMTLGRYAHVLEDMEA
jgi:hypothetical protein